MKIFDGYCENCGITMYDAREYFSRWKEAYDKGDGSSANVTPNYIIKPYKHYIDYEYCSQECAESEKSKATRELWKGYDL